MDAGTVMRQRQNHLATTCNLRLRNKKNTFHFYFKTPFLLLTLYTSFKEWHNRLDRKKIKPIEGNAKCRQWRDFAAGDYLLRHRTPCPHPLTHCIRVYLYTYSHREEGGIEPERKLERQEFTKLGQKYQHDWLYFQSINSDKHLQQRLFTGQFSDDDIFAFLSIYLISSYGQVRIWPQGNRAIQATQDATCV